LRNLILFSVSCTLRRFGACTRARCLSLSRAHAYALSLSRSISLCLSLAHARSLSIFQCPNGPLTRRISSGLRRFGAPLSASDWKKISKVSSTVILYRQCSTGLALANLYLCKSYIGLSPLVGEFAHASWPLNFLREITLGQTKFPV